MSGVIDAALFLALAGAVAVIGKHLEKHTKAICDITAELCALKHEVAALKERVQNGS